MRRLIIGVIAICLVAACSTSSTSPTGQDDAGSGTAADDKDGGGPTSSSGMDGGPNKGDAATASVVVANLSYTNDTQNQLTRVTFVLRNNTGQSVGGIASVDLSFGGTQVASWGDLSDCAEWAVGPGKTSPILTMTVGTYDTDDSNLTTWVTCKAGSAATRRGERPRTTINAIGIGTVKVVVNGILADAMPFVANAEGS